MDELAEKYVKDMNIMKMKRDIIKLVNLVWKNDSIGAEDIAIFYSDAFMDLKADIVTKVEIAGKAHKLSSVEKMELAKALLRLVINNNLEKLVRLVMYELKIESVYHTHIVMMVSKVVGYVMTDDLVEDTFNAIVSMANKIGKQKLFKQIKKLVKKTCCMSGI